MGGKITRAVARHKHGLYKDYMADLGLRQTEFIIFTRQKLQDWIDNLPADCTQVLVYMAIQDAELDVVFWPYNDLNNPLGTEDADEGYNIGNRQPLISYGEL